MKATIAILLAAGAACAGSTAAPVVAAGAAVHDAAPSWARRGDVREGDGHRFVCEGQGSSEETALATARALCDDKICKLCGVEVESVVQTSETLTGVEMQRKVIERCRRVRQGDTELQRKSVDCGPAGCLAWIQIDYSNARRDSECERLASDNFADPAACQNSIEAFKLVEGFTAASFRRRVEILEEALVACAEIDVRPTPLVQSLDEKLRTGMTTFRQGAPRHLRGYWLADHPPLWTAYKESPKLSERLQILLGYLRHKVPLLDVIEATYIDDELLDDEQAVRNLFAKMKAAPREQAYGVQDVHMLAADRLGRQAERGRLRPRLQEIAAWLRSAYAPATVTDWSHVVTMYILFGSDGTVDAEEWAWAKGLSTWRARCLQELMKVERHHGQTRTARLLDAIALARQVKPDGEPGRIFDQVFPRGQHAFLLEVEASLPAELRAALTWERLAENLPSFDAWEPLAPRINLLTRMWRALVDDAVDGRMCNDLYKRIELLDQYGVATTGLSDPICDCLEGPLRNEGARTSVNKSRLYQRAVLEGMPCVQPLRSPS